MTRAKLVRLSAAGIFAGLALTLTSVNAAESEPTTAQSEEGFAQEEVLARAQTFFGETTQGLAQAVEKTFADLGRPNAYIVGEELSGAIGIGARYGQGELSIYEGQSMPVFWQGPSVGFDTGGNASKVLALVYNLESSDDLFQRYPGVDGSLYVVAGASVNYLRSGDVIIAPIRTGVGARAGVSVGYVHFTRKKSLIPF
nr:DUF1134 domain-containing protein [Oceanococcus sp. HetDA_MAG_MS8]